MLSSISAVPPAAGAPRHLDSVARSRQRALAILATAAGARGLHVAWSHPADGGGVDLLWVLPAGLGLGSSASPAIAFRLLGPVEVRTHLLAAYFDLQEVGAPLGVVVLLGPEPDGEGGDFARRVVSRPGSRVAVWTSTELADLAAAEAVAAPWRPAVGEADGSSGARRARVRRGWTRPPWMTRAPGCSCRPGQAR